MPSERGPCTCLGEFEEHEVVVANADDGYAQVCHHAAECQCVEYIEAGLEAERKAVSES